MIGKLKTENIVCFSIFIVLLSWLFYDISESSCVGVTLEEAEIVDSSWKTYKPSNNIKILSVVIFILTTIYFNDQTEKYKCENELFVPKDQKYERKMSYQYGIPLLGLWFVCCAMGMLHDVNYDSDVIDMNTFEIMVISGILYFLLIFGNALLAMRYPLYEFLSQILMLYYTVYMTTKWNFNVMKTFSCVLVVIVIAAARMMNLTPYQEKMFGWGVLVCLNINIAEAAMFGTMVNKSILSAVVGILMNITHTWKIKVHQNKDDTNYVYWGMDYRWMFAYLFWEIGFCHLNCSAGPELTGINCTWVSYWHNLYKLTVVALIICFYRGSHTYLHLRGNTLSLNMVFQVAIYELNQYSKLPIYTVPKYRLEMDILLNLLAIAFFYPDIKAWVTGTKKFPTKLFFANVACFACVGGFCYFSGIYPVA